MLQLVYLVYRNCHNTLRPYNSQRERRLAYMEAYIVLAQVFRQFNLKLYETDRSDIDLAHDFWIPLTKLDSKGVRLQVVGDLA